jgi:hypothetical protein
MTARAARIARLSLISIEGRALSTAARGEGSRVGRGFRRIGRREDRIDLSALREVRGFSSCVLILKLPTVTVLFKL